MRDLEQAKIKLQEGEYTCVVCKGESLYTSTHRGVRPLMEWINQAIDFIGFSAADKVVGKATAFLYVKLGVKAVYARVLSKPALEVLKTHNIVAEYDTLVDNIINRKGDGFCPFELAVLDTQNIDVAYQLIKQKMVELNIQI